MSTTPAVPPTPPPTRVAYTRYASVGHGDDRIVPPIIVWLAWIGGVAMIGWIFFGGFRAGQATMTPVVIPSAPVPIVATPPVSQPVVVAPVVVTPPAPIIRVEMISPSLPLPPSATREITDAERRNEALKERLRRRYGIQ